MVFGAATGFSNEFIINLITNVGFGGVVVYMIAVFIPNIHKLHREERQEWRNDIVKIVDNLSQTIANHTGIIKDLQQQVSNLESEVNDLKRRE